MLNDEFGDEFRQALARQAALDGAESDAVRDRLLRHRYRPRRTRHRRGWVAAGVLLLAGAVAAALSMSGPTGGPAGGRVAPTSPTLALRLVDQQVRLVATAPLAAAADVTAISCADSMQCEAVGTAPGGAGAVAAATDDGGTSWTLQPLPAGVRSLASLACVSATVCLAAGSGPAGPALVATGDGGTTWSVRPLPAGARHGTLAAISCAGISGCWAVGSAAGVGLALHGSEAGTWSTVPLPADVAALRGVGCSAAASPPVCLAVGSANGGGPVTLVADGGAWSEVVSPPGALALASAACTGPGALCTTLAEMGGYWVEADAYEVPGLPAAAREWHMPHFSGTLFPATVMAGTSVCISVGGLPCTPPDASIVDTVTRIIGGLAGGGGGSQDENLSSAYFFSSQPGPVAVGLSPVWYMGAAGKGLIAELVLTPQQRYGTAPAPPTPASPQPQLPPYAGPSSSSGS